MLPAVLVLVLALAACAHAPERRTPIDDVDDPAARTAEIAGVLDGYQAAFRLTWNGARIGEARERFGADVVREGRLDLWTSAERALRAAGVARVDRFDRCTACEPETFFSHRRDAGRTGRQGVIAYVAG